MTMKRHYNNENRLFLPLVLFCFGWCSSIGWCFGGAGALFLIPPPSRRSSRPYHRRGHNHLSLLYATEQQQQAKVEEKNQQQQQDDDAGIIPKCPLLEHLLLTIHPDALASSIADQPKPCGSSATISKRRKKQKNAFHKHLFRHYADVSFDSWCRCADPLPFLRSVGYTEDELEQRLLQDCPEIADMNVHAQLAPKIRFLVETMEGGTGKLTWTDDEAALPSSSIAHEDDDDDECSIHEETEIAPHSMRLDDDTKRIVPPSFFSKSLSLDRAIGPRHAYLQRHGYPHGNELLLRDGGAKFREFLESCKVSSTQALVDLCNQWEKEEEEEDAGTPKKPEGSRKKPLLVHTTKEMVDDFLWEFRQGLIHASQQQQQRQNAPGDDDDDDNMARLMVSHGCNFLEHDQRGVSPLHWAAGAGNLPAVQVLVQALSEGHETDAADTILNEMSPKDGATPLHWACCGMNPYQMGYGGSLSVCRWLLDQAGGDREAELVESKTWTKSSTPLMWASWSGSLYVVDELVRRGADVRARDKDGATAAHWAAAAGHLPVCLYLHYADAAAAAQEARSNDDDDDDDDDDDNDSQKTTPPMCLFLQKDDKGNTPLDYAILYNRQDVMGWIFPTFYASENDSIFLRGFEKTMINRRNGKLLRP